MADSCIFCALKELFGQLQTSRESALAPDALRRALADTFSDQRRFRLGAMDDAAECFENILGRVHAHLAHRQSEEQCAAQHCVPHRKFAMRLEERAACQRCGATGGGGGEAMTYTQMVHYVSTSTLVYQVRANVTGSPVTFGRLLQKAANMGDVRQCPSSCGAVIQVTRTLTNRPEIVSIGLVWNSERPTLEHIMEVFSTIGTTLRMNDVFTSVVDSKWADTSLHHLVGVVTYYGKHYSTFFFHTKLKVWIYFDDANVREVGPRWDQVVEKCRKGRYQPLLLLYALPDGTPVNTESAPKHITPMYNEKKPPQSVLRRSITPSPEKPSIGTTRRAITPNPDGSPVKPPKLLNEYQNLSVIQKTITYGGGTDMVDGRKADSEYMAKKALDFGKPYVGVHRTLSSGSSSGVEISDHMNIPRRRDSGNWSGDRNSASSASSTTMENPYLYLVGKVPHVPGSPTRLKSDSSSGSSGVYDAGYDSYSLSSNDSSTMTTLQHLIKMGHLAKIPEDYNTQTKQPITQSCDVLCDEADELLVKSRQLEDEHDLVLALALCNAAATKARAAMNAPYNNPQTLTLARMKHNTCIMRARSLHRRMTQTQAANKDTPVEIRHTREGSSGSGRHSRQNSRDKGNHSRQNSKELLITEKEKSPVAKNIEIYATLPKKRDSPKNRAPVTTIDDEYMLYNKPAGRESRSIFSRSKSKEPKVREKRSRSEDRSKISKDFSIGPEIAIGKEAQKKKDKEEKEEKEKKEKEKDKETKSKKQHKIRRKLLMGGLIKRKNRSMPDLTDANAVGDPQAPPSVTVDDSKIGLNGSPEKQPLMSGYLSEGHLEFVGSNPNPNLERSKLMRKSFHGSAGKILTAAKVPPPPPIRTTSQLSKSKLDIEEVNSESDKSTGYGYYQNAEEYHYVNHQAPASLPYYHHNSSHSDDSFYGQSLNTTFVTRADVHQEQSPAENEGVDEVDCLPSHVVQSELPPYPSPLGSVIHSRQSSEEFPPPPPPLDLSALDEYLPPISEPSTLLTELQNKRQEIMSESPKYNLAAIITKPSGDTWLKELQAKQAALKSKKDQSQIGQDVVNTQRYRPDELKKSVKDLASKFEVSEQKPGPDNTRETIPPEQIAKEIQEVEMINAAVQKTLGENKDSDEEKKRLSKKKSVSFCDQVILVATADEQEDDAYIPNPILERVLRTAMNKPEAAAIRQEIMSLQNGIAEKMEETTPIQPAPIPAQPRRNSLDNILTRSEPQPIPPMAQNGHQSPIYGQHPGHYPNQGPQSIPHQQYNDNVPSHINHVQNYNPVQNTQYGIQGNYPNPRVHPQHESHNSYPRNPNTQPQEPHGPYLLYKPPNGLDQCCMDSHNPQWNMQQTPYRQSPYQPVPQNSPIYGNKMNHPSPQFHQQMYSAQIRQSTPSPMNGYLRYPPSPTPSTNSNCINAQNMYRRPLEEQAYPQNRYAPPPVDQCCMNQLCDFDNRQPEQHGYMPPHDNSPYQRVPALPTQPQTDQNHNRSYEYSSGAPQNFVYQRVPPNGVYQRPPYQNEVYQRVPPMHPDPEMQQKYPPYQPVPSPKHILKKSVSFEPGTKGGAESPTPKAVVTPIIVNNANNSVPTDKTKCNLCRKKNVVASNLYCQDCEYYMSRFKPRS
ncbi:unnamed protein product [Acanthoscelides obtectus]|nr:unnamed protein product [Acanthoscelides obtectus]CAK1665884.1 Inactive ubiquitin carboxyl-terminal hydrolase 54 [Acanthoscelides obtectus]